MSGGRDDSQKLSFSERDRLRRDGEDPRSGSPRSEANQARADEATSNYLRQAEKHLFGKSGESDQERSAKRVRDAHGTKELSEVCKAYLEEFGIPKEVGLLGVFLDSHDDAITEGALAELLEGEYEFGGGSLRSQLRVLAFHQNDAVAELAEELLERF